jgi:hypothetical protein
MSSSAPIVIAYEDRLSAMPGVELLARSLNRHSPTLKFHIYSPLDTIARRLADLTSVSVIITDEFNNRGWNVKPEILLRALTEHRRVFWLDTDVIITGNIGSLIKRFDEDAFVVGQEFRGNSGKGGHIRATAYGLQPSRLLPHTINSGSIIASRTHIHLIEEWSKLLSGAEYKTAQAQPISKRAAAFVGDQDALWALLSSQDFAKSKVDYFRIGSDMIQHSGANGYHVIDRLLRPLDNGPVFVHMLGRFKPWSCGEGLSPLHNPTEYMHLVCFELSPFFEAAQGYADFLGSPNWLRMRTLPARFFNSIFFGNVALRGLPLALLSWAAAIFGRRPKL